MTDAGPGRGLLVVISGPSGVGKGTVVRALLERLPDAEVSVSATTRSPRPDEQDGVHYRFLTSTEFEEWIEDGRLLEYAEYAGNLYGTPRAPVEAAVAAGRCVILEIEVQGALQVRAHTPDALLVFLTPPDLGELERRLAGRGTEDPIVRQQRMVVARRELATSREFDAVVVNDDLDRCVDEVADLITRVRSSGRQAVD